MGGQMSVAILASEGLSLEALLEAWGESCLSEMPLQLLAVADNPSASVMYAGRPLFFQPLEAYDFGQTALLIVLESDLVVQGYQSLLQGVKCPVLGFRADLQSLDVQMYTGGFPQQAVIGLPLPPVQALLQVLQGNACEALDLVLMYPAALLGQAGIQELASQAARLLNVQAVEHKVFHKQLAFNYYPLTETQLGRELEQGLREDCRRLFADAQTHLRTVQMPVFHGVGMSVSAVLAEPVDIDALKEAWSADGMIDFHESTEGLSNLDVVQRDTLLTLGDVRLSEHDEYRLDFWLGFDEAKFGVGQNLISVAEILLKHHL